VVGQGRIIGIILIAAGVLIDLGVLAWGAAGLAEGRLQPTGFALLMALVTMVLTVPLVGGGIYLMRKGGAETVEVEQLRKEQRLIGMVEAQGTVSIAQAAVELQVSRDQLQAFVYDLVGKGLFTGYVDWKGGKLVAQDAAQIQSATANGTCPNCGGQVELGGKGVVRCPYCGAEIFLSAGAVAGGR
jgi:DNA-directed RNA polymerase subunit RPC12/RpoP